MLIYIFMTNTLRNVIKKTFVIVTRIFFYLLSALCKKFLRCWLLKVKFLLSVVAYKASTRLTPMKAFKQTKNYVEILFNIILSSRRDLLRALWKQCIVRRRKIVFVDRRCRWRCVGRGRWIIRIAVVVAASPSMDARRRLRNLRWIDASLNLNHDHKASAAAEHC